MPYWAAPAQTIHVQAFANEPELFSVDAAKLARSHHCLFKALVMQQELPNGQPGHLGKARLLSKPRAVAEAGVPQQEETAKPYHIALNGSRAGSVKICRLPVGPCSRACSANTLNHD